MSRLNGSSYYLFTTIQHDFQVHGEIKKMKQHLNADNRELRVTTTY